MDYPDSTLAHTRAPTSFGHRGQNQAGRRGLSRLTPVRVLVVEDFVPFRRFIVSTLASMCDLQVIGEVSDGLEAVQKAVELQPELILLDIGLPGLNGIEAARQIRSFVPESNIIFLTQESSADVAREALSLGARAYVVKMRAASELLTAVEAVLLGKTFVSSSIGNREFHPPT
jgi:DNA-binding NarL/FixJ family response regulator